MRKLFSKTTLVAGFALALAFTFFGCPGGNHDWLNGDESSSSVGNEQTYNYCITAAYGCVPGPFTASACNGQVANSCPNSGGVSSSSVGGGNQQTYNYCITASGCLAGPFTVSACNGQVANSCPNSGTSSSNATPTPTPSSSSVAAPVVSSSSAAVSGGTGDGSEANPIALTSNVWVEGNITSDLTKTGLWYSFNVVAGATYRVWSNHQNTNALTTCGNGSKTLIVKVSATHSDGTKIFTDISCAWGTAQQFIATSNGTVKLKVMPSAANAVGTFGIVYSSTNTLSRPSTTGNPGSDESIPIALTAGKWAIGNIALNEWVWYSINVTDGNMYYIWWNDSVQGDKTYSGNVDVTAYKIEGGNFFYTIGNGWTTPQSFIATSNGTVKVLVRGNTAGTYGIVFSTSNTRP